MSIVVIGKNSFLARAAAAHPGCDGWVFLSHDEALADKGWTRGADCVINFAFDPALHQGYDAQQDVDAKIADSIGRNTHYIMMSSRLVYDTAKPGLTFHETDRPAPDTPYGATKLRIENNLIEGLGLARVTILRLGNIFGDEYGRKSFFGMALTRLKDEGKIVFDIAPDSKRDFLSAQRFARALEKIVATPQGGIFNLGSGIGVAAADIAAWLILGYGQGEAVYTDKKTQGQFRLDMSKTRKSFGLEEVTSEDLQADVMECGRRLKLA